MSLLLPKSKEQTLRGPSVRVGAADPSPSTRGGAGSQRPVSEGTAEIGHTHQRDPSTPEAGETVSLLWKPT